MTKETKSDDKSIKSLLDIDRQYGKSTPMTKEQTEIYFQCTMFDQGLMHSGSEQHKEFEAMEQELVGKDIGYQVIKERMKWVGIDTKVSFPVKLMIRYICETPGQMSMWVYTFFQALKEYDQITMSELSEMFPWGFPTKEDYSSIWDAQKKNSAPHSNAIDDILIYQ